MPIMSKDKTSWPCINKYKCWFRKSLLFGIYTNKSLTEFLKNLSFVATSLRACNGRGAGFPFRNEKKVGAPLSQVQSSAMLRQWWMMPCWRRRQKRKEEDEKKFSSADAICDVLCRSLPLASFPLYYWMMSYMGVYLYIHFSSKSTHQSHMKMPGMISLH